MKYHIITLLWFSLSCFSLPVFAIVDIEIANISENNPAFEAKLNASVSGKSGNSDARKSGIGGRLQWADENSISFAIFDAEKGESSGVRDSNNNFLHLRYIKHLIKNHDYELFAQTESDEFKRLSLRGLVGGGVRTRFLGSSEAHNMYLGVGAFSSVEKLDALAGTSDAGRTRYNRANIYLLNQHQLSASTKIKNTLYYQPDMGATEDYRLLEKFRLEVSINTSLSVLLAFDVSYDNVPPQGVDKRDVSYVTGLQYKFR